MGAKRCSWTARSSITERPPRITTAEPALALHPARPNPFNPTTTLAFTLPQRTVVRLAIYNVDGSAIRTLATEALDAGPHTFEWDGRDDGGHAVSSGIYFARLTASGRALTQKMVLIK